MGQGKSNAARVVMAGAALDPLAELWVFVFANNGDFDAYQPRLSRYHRGVDEQTTRAAVEALHALYAEVGRREARLAELGAKKVTRPLAAKHPDLRPLAALFSECHELFGTPTTAGRRPIWRCRRCAGPQDRYHVGVRYPVLASGRDPTEDRGASDAERVLRGQVVALERRSSRRTGFALIAGKPT